MKTASLCILLAIATAPWLSGCERTFRDMYDQPKLKPLAESPVWTDGRGSRPSVEGTVARSMGAFAGSTSGRRQGVTEDVEAMPASAMSADLLARGRERFDIYCSPCHGYGGDGDGMVVRRGFPAPPSYHIDRLRNAPDAHFYDVITHGYGAMYPYATRVPPADRVAVVAYIRALQLAQHAPIALVPSQARAALEAQR